MKKNLLLVLFFLMLTSVYCAAQDSSGVKKSYTTFDFFYMDNNHGPEAIGLNDSLIEKMVFEIRKLLRQKDKGFLLFRSNGDRPQVTDRKEDVFTFEFRDGIYEQNTSIPNFLEDKKRIREYLYDSLGVISDKVNLHFFFSENALGSLMEEPNSIMTNFSREFAGLFSAKNAEINVFIYYNKEIVSLNEVNLNTYLEFYNGTTYAERRINFKIIKS
ncbi:MAG TPA: hypothetical protein PLU53_04765 [Bacteroidia bacterium]|nr:hypothetical protein [Bacteroidia bacterium]